MTNIWDFESRIKNLKIKINKIIAINVLDIFDFFFTTFLGNISYKTIKKKKIPILANLA